MIAEQFFHAPLTDVDYLPVYTWVEGDVNYRTYRVAMKDASAQTTLRLFMNAGMDQVGVNSAVHCDNMTQMYKGAKAWCATITLTNKNVDYSIQDVSSRL